MIMNCLAASHEVYRKRSLNPLAVAKIWALETKTPDTPHRAPGVHFYFLLSNAALALFQLLAVN